MNILHNPKRDLFLIILFFIGIVLFPFFDKKEPAIEKKYKYTIYVGSPCFSMGYVTNEFKDTLGYFTFTRKDGVVCSYKSNMILKVETNKK